MAEDIYLFIPPIKKIYAKKYDLKIKGVVLICCYFVCTV